MSILSRNTGSMFTSAKERLEPALVLAAIVVVLGTTIVAVALHQLSIDFHTTVSTIQWVTTGYLLSLALVISLSGWATHRLGAERV